MPNAWLDMLVGSQAAAGGRKKKTKQNRKGCPYRKDVVEAKEPSAGT